MAANAMPRESLSALRETIARIEGKICLSLVDAVVSEARERGELSVDRPSLGDRRAGLAALFPDGMPASGLIELRSETLRHATAVTGFALALATIAAGQAKASPPDKVRLMWIGEPVVAGEAGLPYATGLRDFGLDPASVVYGMPRRLAEALWLAEAALTSRAFSVVLMEVRGNPQGFGLTESRRLSLKARDTGKLVFLLRQGGQEEAGSTLVRLRIEPAFAGRRTLPGGAIHEGSLGHPAFHIVPEKTRLPVPSSLILEWNIHERQFYPAAPSGKQFASPHVRPAYPGAAFSPAADGSDRPSPLGSVLAFERAS